jgi:hypothetical protein
MITNAIPLESVRPMIAKYIKRYDGELHENTYYMGIAREHSTSKPMLDFHNFVKYILIASVCSASWRGGKEINLLDTSSGRGGDLSKWLSDENHVKFVMGLDISRDLREASKRLYNSRPYNQKGFNKDIVFAMSDTSKNIKDGESLDIDGVDKSLPEMIYSKHILDILYGRNLGDIPEEYADIKHRLQNRALDGFDVVSSQFSIHYYFKNTDTLMSYIRNISDNTNKNGYFIGTCYDGERVYNLLEDNDGEVEYLDDMGNLVYSLKRDYGNVWGLPNDFAYDMSGDLNMDDLDKYLGNRIKVYMETIGQELPEYLVNFDLFKHIMEDWGFKLIGPGVYKDSKPVQGNRDVATVKISLPEGQGTFEDIYKQYIKNDSSVFSRFGQAHALKDNKDLQKLSYLNNWFVFQKIE